MNAYAVNIKELNISDNRLISITGIINLKSLTRLFLGNNQLISIVGIENLYNFTYAYCSLGIEALCSSNNDFKKWLLN